MTRFVDGPAAGVSLDLRRLPIFLRVVRDPEGKWDALDQLTDVPAPDEALVAYRKIAGSESSGFLDYTDKKTGRRCGRTFVAAKYAVVTEQPDDATMRDASKWREWCQEQAKPEVG